MAVASRARTTGTPPSIKELMATFLARDMADGEEIFVGTNLPVIRAGVLLAHLHHGPSMRVMVAHTRTNLYHTPVMEYFELLADWRGARWAEAYFNDNEIVMYQKSRRDSVFFVGALQIDRFGNILVDCTRAERRDAIERALDLGVNYIDTSARYGGPARWSEHYLGLVMKRRRAEAFLATKTHDRTRDGSLRLLDKSFELLQTDHLDLWQLHNLQRMDEVDQIFARGGAIEASSRSLPAASRLVVSRSAMPTRLRRGVNGAKA